MDFVTGMMMTAVALFSDVESPMGHVPMFGGQETTPADAEAGESTEAPVGEFPQMVNERRMNMGDSIAAAFDLLAEREMQRPQQDGQRAYAQARELAERHRAEWGT